MKRFMIFIAPLLIGTQLYAQSPRDTLSLADVYEILYTENPVTDKIRTSRQITDLNERIAKSGWYPDFELNASASYQSEVVEFPFESPGFDIPNFSKDHYNLSVNVTQPIFDGGRTRASKQLEDESGDITEASLKSDLLKLKEQVDRIYFGIMILQKQREIISLAISDMEEQLEIVQSQVENGVLLPGNEATLRAEILNREQQLTKIGHDIIAGYEALNEILGGETPMVPTLILPEKEHWRKPGPMTNRPELDLLAARGELFETQKDLANAGKLPQVSLFARPFYGRPGFNLFEDDLQFNWIVGIQARWSLKTARNASIKTDVLHLQQKNITEDRTLFERQQNAALRRLNQEIMGLEEQIERDAEIVELRNQVAEEKRNLVEEGSATVTEYIRELNEFVRAQLQLELRKIQRVQAIINYETEQGWTWKE
ncbi:TolC family protein [Rhodohalobacter sulfatireducens]|uniref:TolC family protein n=1 Tax=Rhodohalobacter sulfatireducens TaxID=2911366 RepID=A0ABS9KIF9_9BACT|nr:TolC family protein [Rhodohalobacter sulfatireducens]MCG2590645.1 TolC family protein [Rhodohalobacter sulfatireducens]